MRGMLFAVAASAAGLLASSASADTFSYATDFGAGVGPEWSISAPVNSAQEGLLGQLGDGASSATLSRASAGASTAANNGALRFDLYGFRTLDGHNCCTDEFNLIVNGVTIFQAAFALGGGGGESIDFNPNGGSVINSGFDQGGQFRTLLIPFTALAGINTFQFLYPGLQSFGDEAFGLDNVSFSAEVAAAAPGVPEPASWALMILGFGGAGAALRSRRRPMTATA